MLGNCAIGRLRIVMAPTITMTMEITIATMGRLIKNFDIALPSLALRGKRLGVHLRARTRLLHALGNHTFALLEPFRNNPLRTDAVANRHRSNAYFIVATHNGDLVAALELRHRPLRNKQRTLLEADDSANFAITAGTQNIVWIAKQPGDPNCARAFVDLAVGEVERALVRIR